MISLFVRYFSADISFGCDEFPIRGCSEKSFPVFWNCVKLGSPMGGRGVRVQSVGLEMNTQCVHLSLRAACISRERQGHRGFKDINTEITRMPRSVCPGCLYADGTDGFPRGDQPAYRNFASNNLKGAGINSPNYLWLEHSPTRNGHECLC